MGEKEKQNTTFNLCFISFPTSFRHADPPSSAKSRVSRTHSTTNKSLMKLYRINGNQCRKNDMKPFFCYLAFFLINLTIEARNNHVSSKFSSKRASFHSKLHKIKSFCFFTFRLNVLSGVFYSVEDLSQESWSGFGADDRRHCNLNSKSDVPLSHRALPTPNVRGLQLVQGSQRRTMHSSSTIRVSECFLR